MVFDPQDNIFMLAGPVKIHPRVLKAMNTPSIGHRSPEFSEVNRELKRKEENISILKDQIDALTKRKIELEKLVSELRAKI